MTARYKKIASERRKVRKVQRHPELRLTAEIAGVSYWMAYKVMRGQAQSAKVTEALKTAQKRLRAEKEEGEKATRRQLRALRAEEKKLARLLTKEEAAA